MWQIGLAAFLLALLLSPAVIEKSRKTTGLYIINSDLTDCYQQICKVFYIESTACYLLEEIYKQTAYLE
jgi:hypothetical protein